MTVQLIEDFGARLQIALEAGDIKRFRFIHGPDKYEIGFLNGSTMQTPLFVETVEGLDAWIENINWNYRLKQWRVIKEVIKRKAVNKYGYRAKRWFRNGY